jgi:hypothetical protein
MADEKVEQPTEGVKTRGRRFAESHVTIYTSDLVSFSNGDKEFAVHVNPGTAASVVERIVPIIGEIIDAACKDATDACRLEIADRGGMPLDDIEPKCEKPEAISPLGTPVEAWSKGFDAGAKHQADTFRRDLAAKMMHSLVMDALKAPRGSAIATVAVGCTDALIAELAKGKP